MLRYLFLMIRRRSLLVKLDVLALGLLVFSTFACGIWVPQASALSQPLIATPGYVNLGMNVTISVIAPAAGTYTVLVQGPSGPQFSLNETFTAASQMQNVTFGNASTGFGALISHVGTYNVFLEQGGAPISSTSFYATNELLVTMTVVNSGTCILVQGVDRGVKIFPRFFISYASNNQKITNSDQGISVKFTLPNGTLASAGWDPYAKLFVGGVLPNWNYTEIGPWSPNATVSDAAGNTATYNYSGTPFDISPASLNTTVAVVNSATNQTLSGLANGTSATILAVINYPTNAEPVTGFVAPLDSAKRGGVVTALVGWGYYNATSQSFGGGNTTGGEIAKLPMSYTGAGGVWEANYTSSSIPAIKPGTAYKIVVTSKDDASPPNTGFAALVLGPAAGQAVSTNSSSASTATTVSSSSQSSSTSSISTIPLWAYAGTTIALIVGVIVGFLARRPQASEKK